MFTTIIIFIVILGLLVFVHEFGHFIVARRTGMKVDEFGFGFPPRAVGIQKINGKLKWVWGHKDPLDKEKTVYSINLIPLGGFVKIRGENNEHEEDPRSFINRPFWARFWTLVAGVTMNVILAWILISVGYMVGLPVAIDDPNQIPAGASFKDSKIAIIEVVKDLPADKAGLTPSDVVLKIDGREFSSIDEFRGYIRENAGQKFTFEIQRGKEIKNVEVQSEANPRPGEGPTGIALANLGLLKFPAHTALWQGLQTTGMQISNIATGFYSLITSRIGLDSLGGPVQIAKLTGQVADLGFIYLLQFTSFLSLNLAFLNILPFPALDGGRVVFLIIEKIRGKRNNQKLEQIVNTFGFVFLLMLMALVTIKDIRG
jgi:regulator of sigma E protease